MASKYERGTVDSYDDRAGYGYVIPDEPTYAGQRLLLHRKSLRSANILLESGERVIYRTEQVPRGLLAADVYPESAAADSSDQSARSGCTGVVAFTNPARGFGFIDSAGEKGVFFHFSQLPNPDLSPPVGTQVFFTLGRNERGYFAEDIGVAEGDRLEPALRESDLGSGGSASLLAAAILARDAKNLDRAAELYQQGMRDSPSVQLILSYAAMEKNRNRRQEAMAIYERGLRIYPNNLKLCEDAGRLAASIGEHQRAIQLFRHGLALGEGAGQGVERLFLLALARIHYQRDSRADLEICIEYYQRAMRAFQKSHFGKGAFPNADQLTMTVARMRVTHPRGQLTFEFMNHAGFKIIRARMPDQITLGAELVVEISNPELVESYGIARHLLVRCMFKSEVTLADIESLESSLEQWGESGLVDDQVSLLIVDSLPVDVERLLSRRLEQRRTASATIVPMTQAQIELADDAMGVLRQVLDRWLYRRDLFAQNFPVSGRRFFGRDKPLAELKDAIANGTAAGIFGLRKVGKTSLLKEIERRSSEGGDIVIYMDLLRVPADVSDARWIYWKLSAELYERFQRHQLKGVNWRLGGRFADYFDVPQEFPVATAFDSDLTQVLTVLRQSRLEPRPRLVLMLDEIERLLPTGLGKEGFEGFFDFLGYLRGLAQESDDFVPIITGANAAVAEAAQFRGRDNPVFNFFREIYLPFLQRGETSEMICTLGGGMGIRFASDAVERIHALTGGHPFFTRRFCSYLSERYVERPLMVSVEAIDRLVEPYLEIANKDFQEIVDRFARDYPEELEACVRVAHAGGTIELSELAIRSHGNVSLRHLLGYQVVALDGNSVRLTMELMRRWLARSDLAVRQ